MDLANLVDDAMAGAGADSWAVVGSGDATITGLAHDSRRIRPGDLFFAVPGARSDGHDFVARAVAAGAAAVVVQRLLSVAVPQVVVPSVRAAMPWLAAVFHGRPSRHLSVIGITGTNGKTTTAHIIADLLTAAGRSAEAVGTLTGVRTTPEAPELQATLAAAVDRGRDAVAMEVSSHALDQGRAGAVWFEVGVFTNLSPDHLDYHHTMEAYFAAKARLFDRSRVRSAVVNVDDAWGRRLVDQVDVPAVSVQTPRAHAVLRGLCVPVGRPRHQLPPAGRLQRDQRRLGGRNGSSAGRGRRHHCPGPRAPRSGAGTVRGRGEPATGPAVVVDYAHTPDGLEKVLDSARSLVGGGRVVVVFGCGGDRDRDKRPLMGDVAGRLADRCVVTSDNPRDEDPMAIIAEITAGMAGAVPDVEPDRAAAIARAISVAGPEDVVVIAGKGHETTQTIGDEVRPFDDRHVARQLLGGVS